MRFYNATQSTLCTACSLAPSLSGVLQHPLISIIVICDEGLVDSLNRQIAAQNTVETSAGNSRVS